MKKRTAWRAVVGVLVGGLVIATAVQCQGEEFPSRAFKETTSNDSRFATRDMTPVGIDIRFRGERVTPIVGLTSYSVPKAYLYDARHWSGGELDVFIIHASWPTMQPMPIYAEELYQHLLVSRKEQLEKDKQTGERTVAREWSDADFHNSVLMWIRYSHCLGWVKSEHEEIVRWGRLDKTYTDPMFEKFDMYSGGSTHNSTFVPRQQESLPAYIRCTTLHSALNRCNAITNYDGLVALEVNFSKRHLHQYKEILAKSRDLVGSFITSNKPTADIPASCLKDVKVK